MIGLLLYLGPALRMPLAIVGLLIVQGLMMRRFMADPVRHALWYSGFGVPLFVSGMMVSAFALRGLAGLPPDDTPPSHRWAGWASPGSASCNAMLGAVVVLTTSTLNRVMVVELALPALLPGLLVALHHAVQLTRPRMGYGSDVGGRRTPWIMLVASPCWRMGGFAGQPSPPTWMAREHTRGRHRAGRAGLRAGGRWGSAPAAPRCWCCWPSAWTNRAAPPLRRWCG